MNVLPDPWVWVSFRIHVPGQISDKLWRKLARPPKPWKRARTHMWDLKHTQSLFSACVRSSEASSLDYSWVEQYILTMMLIAN